MATLCNDMTIGKLNSMINSTVVKLITDFISNGFGVKHPGSNELAVDLRGFHLGNTTQPFRTELLMPNKEPVAFIDERRAYSADGYSVNLSALVDDQANAIIEIFDTLHALKSQERYHRVTLRAIVTSEDPDFINGAFDFPQNWNVYDSETENGQLCIRLDTTFTVSALSVDDAIETAIAHPPTLNLDGLSDDKVQVEFWVDSDQPDVMLVGTAI